jgi:glc operon protein GlcG
MQTKFILTVAEVNRIIEAARAEAEKCHWSVAIAVVDDGGNPLGLLRLDNCAPIGAYIAVEKARTAALGRRPSGQYEEMINNGRNAFLSAPIITSLAGGVPVVVAGQVIGAVGVSGVKPDQDSQVATVGANTVSA